MRFRIGVLGTAEALAKGIDPNVVKMMLMKCFGDVLRDNPQARDFVLVSRAVKTGIPGIAYDLVSSREHGYGWPTWSIGVTSLKKAERFALDEWLPRPSSATVAQEFAVLCDALILVHFRKNEMLQGIADRFTSGKGGKLYECALDLYLDEQK